MRIAVVGCGTAGPAAALLLARDGHAVELFERAPALHPVGAGFLLQPTGLGVLERLGLLGAVAERGARIEGLRTRTVAGRELLHLDYADLRPGLHALGLQRAALLEVLVEALAAEGVPVQCGVEVGGLEPLERGFAVLDVGGRRLGDFDWLLVADGARSGLRTRSALPAQARPYPWGAVWAVLPDPDERVRGALVQCVDGARHMVGLLPSGRSRPDQAPAVSLFLSARLDRAPVATEADLARVREEALRLLPEAEPLLVALRDPAQLALAGYFDVRVPRPAVAGLALLGDAAHAMSPQLGQGVNLALCDAEAFAAALLEAASPAEAAARYTAARRAHLRFYQQATRWLTPFFQSDSRALGALRDLAFPLAGTLPPLRRQMTRAMAGLKQGWLAPSLPLSELGRAD